MDQSNFRLIFQGVERNDQLKRLLAFFLKELALSEDQIRKLLPNPPRILAEAIPQKDAELIHAALKNMGCRTSLEPVTADPSYPFVISKKHQNIITAELSKILRCSSTLALLVVQVAADRTESLLPSMMGPFQESVAEHLRISDTIIGVDDRRLIVLGFSTGRDGIEVLHSKTSRTVMELLGEKALVSAGSSLFPEDGRSLPELVQLAELKRLKEDASGLPDTRMDFPTKNHGQLSIQRENEIKLTPLQLCFTEARGKIFRRLINIDPQTLWLGLSQLPQVKQKEFLARLPFDAQLAPILEKMIDTQPQAVQDTAAEQHFEAIIHQMRLDDGLEERKRVYKELSSRLNHVETLPTLPSIAALVFTIASDSDSSAVDLTKVIENDPSLTSKLLKTVNSAFYGFPQKIGSVRQAVVILGTDEITNLAFGLAAAKVFQSTILEGFYGPRSLWHHSICTALISQKLCEKLPDYQNPGAFTAGLLHDFGKILLIESFPALYSQTHVDVADHYFPLFELEEERFGLNHAAIGRFLSSNWNLPEALVQAIAYHHQPLSAANNSHLAAIVGLADYLYYHATALEETAEEVPFLFPQLTFGHWRCLTELFRGLNGEQLKEMTDAALVMIQENQDLLTLLE